MGKAATTLREILANNLVRSRTAQGFTQAELAYFAEIDIRVLVEVESAATALSIDGLERLARALKTEAAILLMIQA